MLPEQQQRILGYFIEEAKDHLNTIEQGLLNLQSTLDDPEMINEVFRAAHSIKGGAAMLGLGSIQHTAHRLEDCFKILKDHPIQVDQKLESLFLGVSDTLKALLEQLQRPYGLSEDTANNLMSEAEPVFQWLHEHLELLIKQESSGKTTLPKEPAANLALAPSVAKISSKSPTEIQNQVIQTLREMLQLFRQTATPENRHNLQECCHQLAKLGEELDWFHWCSLCRSAGSAIKNPDNSYLILAKIVITDIRQGLELVLAGKETEIVISEQLEALIGVPEIELLEISLQEDDFTEAVTVKSTPELHVLTSSEQTDHLASGDEYSRENPPQQDMIASLFELSDQLPSDAEDSTKIITNHSITDSGPVVGIADLTELDKLFHNETAFDDGWIHEEILDLTVADELEIERSNSETEDADSFEFLLEENTHHHQDKKITAKEELTIVQLFDEDFLDEENKESQNQETPLFEIEFLNEELIETIDVTPTQLDLDQLIDTTRYEDQLLFTDEITSAELLTDKESTFDDLFLITPEIISPKDEILSLSDLMIEIEEDTSLEVPLDKSIVSFGNLEIEDSSELDSEVEENAGLALQEILRATFLEDEATASVSNSVENPFLVSPFVGDLNPNGHDIPPSNYSLPPEVLELTPEFTDLSPQLPEVPFDDTTDEITLVDAELDFDWLNLEPESNDDQLEQQHLDFSDDLFALEYPVDIYFADTSELPMLPSANQVVDIEAITNLSTEDLPSFTDDNLMQDEFVELDQLLKQEVDSGNSMPEQEIVALEELLTMLQVKPDASKQVIEDQFLELEQMVKGDLPLRPTVTRTPRFEQLMKVPVKHLDELSNLVGELVVNRNTLEQDQERLRQSLDNLLIQIHHLSDVGARMQELYERSLLEASLLASRKNNSASHPDTDRGFSELEMDRFTPFHSLSQEMIEMIVRVRESASDIDFVTEETERVARQFRQVTTQLQEGITRSRMEHFAEITTPLERGVRESAIKRNKQAQLVIEGRDTLIDKMILEHLKSPLTHLLNNAIAHGIETPLEREAVGKKAMGVITVRAFHQGNQTVISVKDDGAGIDLEAVKAKAIKNGKITSEQAKTMSRVDIYDLLFHPGFSTKDEADDMAGRGVGLDVVLTNISEIRGTINIDSTIGKGTTFTIRLPLTLSICKALCCVSDKARIAFPMDGVEDTLDIAVKNVQHGADGQKFIFWRDTMLPFRPLKELLTFNRQLSRGNVYGGNRDDDMISVVVVRSANTMIALQVDQVLNEQEIVIKQFEGPAPKPIGVAGATVLGDGRIMPIADVLEIIDIFQGRTIQQRGPSIYQQKNSNISQETAVKIDPTVLIVDDSITVRELLSLTFNKAGYRVEQARDGQEAWDKLRSGLPCDIVFCDIEMPRCDGLELLSRIQKDSGLNHLPIAMLTSRGADKHRQMAVQLGASGYFTKPYLEEALLEAATRMLKGEKLLVPIPERD